MIKICKICKKEYIPHSRGKKGKLSKFCSNKCKFIYQKENSPRKRTGTYKKCLICEKKFYVQKNESHYKCCSSKCANFSRRGRPNEKHSKKMSELISSGKYNPKRNYYKQGIYKSKITKNLEYYASSYELKRMKQLDKLKLYWTKKHHITIPYKDKNGISRYYIPDFLVNKNIIEEVKPSRLVNSEMDNNLFKQQAAIKFCNTNGFQYRIITEKELNTL